MAEILIWMDFQLPSAIRTTEQLLPLLRQSNVADIIDYVDADEVEVYRQIHTMATDQDDDSYYDQPRSYSGEMIVWMDFPSVSSANDIDTTELSLLIKRSTAANVKEFVDADDVSVHVRRAEPDYEYQQPLEARDPYTAD